MEGDILAPEQPATVSKAVRAPKKAPTTPSPDPVAAEVPAPRRARRGASKAALSEALAEVTPSAAAEPGATAPVAQEALIRTEEIEATARHTPAPAVSDDYPPAARHTPAPALPDGFGVAPVERTEPERIIPPTPFSIIFQSPDLATDDDVAPSAASERVQQRRRPAYQRPTRRS